LRSRFVIYMAVFMFLVILAGCDQYIVHEGQPNIKGILFGTTCGGSEVSIINWYVGNRVNIGVDFYTSNVDQEFDVAVLFDSDTVPEENVPAVANVVTFQTLSKESNSAKGLKRALFPATPGCDSAGVYQITVIITDSNGDSDTAMLDFGIVTSPGFGDAACTCVTQCGMCTQRFTTFDRCNCGCPFVGEKCT
jgi:hypothetical protein